MDYMFIECGCCGHYHSPGFTGDCREDGERFTATQIEMEFGPNVWDRVLDLDEQMRMEEHADENME